MVTMTKLHKLFKAETGDEGRVTAVVSTFNVVDTDGDVVRPTAFTDGQEVPMVWAHDWSSPIGKGSIKVQPDRAIFEGQFFMDTTKGAEAFRTVKAMGSLQEYSWGFRITDAEIGEPPEGQEASGWHGAGKVQYINGAEVFEVSPVLVGANRETGTLEIKSIETEIAAIKRRYSRADTARLRTILASVTELIGELEEEEDSDDGKQSEEWQDVATQNVVQAAEDELERLAIDIS